MREGKEKKNNRGGDGDGAIIAGRATAAADLFLLVNGDPEQRAAGPPGLAPGSLNHSTPFINGISRRSFRAKNRNNMGKTHS